MFARLAILALMLFGACGSTDEPGGTWAVDCVAVLGGPPANAMMPLSAVPFSGVPRDKYIGDLSDVELGKFCDFVQCLSGDGYRYVREQSRLEAPTIMAEVVNSSRRTPPHYRGRDDLQPDSRESCSAEFRRTDGHCRVGLVEDCNREWSIWPIAYALAPSCGALEFECPL